MKFTTLAITFAMLTLPMMAQAQQKPKVTRIQAEHAALAQIKRGKVLGAEYELESGKYVWSLSVKSPAGIREVWVDPTSGMVIKNDAESTLNEKKEMGSERKPQMITKAKAEKIALKAVPHGKVLDAELETESGVRVWSLDVKWGKQIKEVWINPVNGKVMKVTTENAKKEKQEKTAGMTGKKSMK